VFYCKKKKRRVTLARHKRAAPRWWNTNQRKASNSQDRLGVGSPNVIPYYSTVALSHRALRLTPGEAKRTTRDSMPHFVLLDIPASRLPRMVVPARGRSDAPAERICSGAARACRTAIWSVPAIAMMHRMPLHCGLHCAHYRSTTATALSRTYLVTNTTNGNGKATEDS